jgi:hypothetical protein
MTCINTLFCRYIHTFTLHTYMHTHTNHTVVQMHICVHTYPHTYAHMVVLAQSKVKCSVKGQMLCTYDAIHVCVYVYSHTYIYVHTYGIDNTCRLLCMYESIYVCAHVYAYTYKVASSYIIASKDMAAQIHTSDPTQCMVHIPADKYIHTDICIYLYKTTSHLSDT